MRLNHCLHRGSDDLPTGEGVSQTDIGLMLDANNAYDATTAIKAGKAYENYDIMWFEEPVWPDDLKGSAKVARKLVVPVASGELEYTRYGFRDLIENDAADILQPDGCNARVE